MKTLYLECKMGASGDMLTAALLELLDDPEGFLDRLNGFGLPGVRVARRPAVKCGLVGSRVDVYIHEQEEGQDYKGRHEHVHFEDIIDRVRALPVASDIKDDVTAVYKLIAEAEALVHGQPVLHIHFHEVGSWDAVADILAVCLLLKELRPERVISSPVHVGGGMVQCAHGLLPVPAPATVRILQGIPVYGGDIQAELCTPTGAALLKYFVHEFGAMPPMVVAKTGYGMGKKDFPAANCLRAFWGESGESAGGRPNGSAAELQCNVDDMTGEAIGFAVEELWQNGALDVWLTPVQMKKNRPGVLLSCLCPVEDADRFASLILAHTTTFGVRKKVWERYVLERSFAARGAIRVKAGIGYGVHKEKVEYEDAAAAAREKGARLQNVYEGLMQDRSE